MARPNILFIQVDQLMAKALRIYGDPVCHAPNIDRLASRGTVFEAAYCNFPLCAPSRFSMATGRLCSEIGAYDNAAEMPASVPTYAHYLRAAGYQTALSGKMHFIGPDQFHGFEKRLTPDIYPADFSWAPNWGDEGVRDTNDARSILISGICENSVQIDFDEMVTNKAIEHLHALADSSDQRPFFLQVSYTHPHEPYLCRKRYWDLYEGVQIPPPSVPALPAAHHDPHSRRLLADFSILDMTFDDADIARARQAYYGSISFLDDLIGRLLKALDESDLGGDTALVFTSDHGDMLGERGLWFKKHFFEPSLRVPLFIVAPGFARRRIATPVSLVDLLPTFMGIAEGNGWSSEFEPLDGVDLASLLDQPDWLDRPVYAEYLAEATTSPILMIRRGSYKFVWSEDDPPLLYNVESDPDECTNLANDPKHFDLVARFRCEIKQKWDSAALTQRIILNKHRRQGIHKAHTHGEKPRRNHAEKPGEEEPWYRGEGGYNDWAFPDELVSGES